MGPMLTVQQAIELLQGIVREHPHTRRLPIDTDGVLGTITDIYYSESGGNPSVIIQVSED